LMNYFKVLTCCIICFILHIIPLLAAE
jgi:hypothetical protein